MQGKVQCRLPLQKSYLAYDMVHNDLPRLAQKAVRIVYIGHLGHDSALTDALEPVVPLTASL